MILIWRHPSQGTQSPESLFDSFHFVVDGSFEIQPFTSWGLTYFFPIIYRVLEHHPTGDLFGTPESTNVSRPPLDDVSVEPRSGRFIQKKNEEMEWMLSKTTVETSEILEHFQRSYTFSSEILLSSLSSCLRIQMQIQRLDNMGQVCFKAHKRRHETIDTIFRV